MGMLDDVDDAQTIEGIGEAQEKVLHFIKNILESLEGDRGTFVFSLYKHGRGSEEEDPVFTSEIDVGDNPNGLTEEIIDAAKEDVAEFYKGSHKYVVRAADVKARCIFTLKVNTQEDEDMEDVEEAPNKRGLLGQMMRHQEKIMKVAVGSVSKVMDMVMKSNKDKDARIEALEAQQVNNIKLAEELISGKHTRDIELRRITNKEKRMEEITGMVLQGAPMLLQLVAQSGQKAVQGAPEEDPGIAIQQQPQNGGPQQTSRIEALVEGLIDDISDEQLAKMASSGMFTPVQMMALGEIAQGIRRKREAAQVAAQVANAVANGSVRADNRS